MNKRNKLVKVLQIGDEDWRSLLLDEKSEKIQFFFCDAQAVDLSILDEKFGIYLFTSMSSLKLLKTLFHRIAPYYVLYDAALALSKEEQRLLLSREAYAIDMSDPIKVYQLLNRDFTGGQLGAKMSVDRLDIADSYTGLIHYDGHLGIELSGDFGSRFSQILTWRYDIPLGPDSDYELWPAFAVDGGVQIKLRVSMIAKGGSHIQRQVVIGQAQLQKPFLLQSHREDSFLAFSIEAQGRGHLKIGPLHYRKSRHGYGQLVVGGQRHADTKREELLFYFNPGDLKPPLNVYFSGYRSAEGFEGYGMMKALKAPFLLVADPRIEGGSFYLGSRELERNVLKQIDTALSKLGFNQQQLILSGLSMGSFGALYYGSSLHADAIIVGKPLVNIGSIAANEKMIRPGGFPTSLDILRSLTKETRLDAGQELNDRFWRRFLETDFQHTKIAIAYMLNDDYDSTAYDDLLSVLQKQHTQLISKGIPGRHNDNSPAINDWFLRQYHNILRHDFQRGAE
ncbi:accessory Sec system protein Asp2 [Oenococcus kitaharae]|uniref:Asp2-like accessory secretory protein n=1 Tax=Oenococcus kitaharae DSM 17330 TaxID=1045004 RepID=G9WHE7_9LACO|nr:accessory Sec system protein Asp2 [Oenococcus kitaharae]EHN59939.1 Asp2-like accessory secretory protein [Oenococcus kitaharae DSM 17330]OEY82123.1 accessory secretory protein Asp2 [Oenococcus kitaharae]OEY82422.1 accessory secretory protein Asp2 [Oenococcus kitaharae]OEY83836.1 accessory secretory protein Asp2 [Oenococcus kitaharae]